MYTATVVSGVSPIPGSNCASGERENVVNNTCEASLRSVNEIFAAAAAPNAAEIPGTISNSIFAALNAYISSAARPNSNGSPPFNRTTTSCFPADATNSELISSCDSHFFPHRFPTSIRSTPAGIKLSIAALTSESCSTTPARSSSRTAFTVNNSGSPGPAPTKNTLPITPHLSSHPRKPHAPQTVRTPHGWPANAATVSPTRDRHRVPAASPAPSLATPATAHTPRQTAAPIPCGAAAPTPDSSHLSKWRSANRLSAQSTRNKSDSSQCRPPRCTKCSAHPLPETPRDSIR